MMYLTARTKAYGNVETSIFHSSVQSLQENLKRAILLTVQSTAPANKAAQPERAGREIATRSICDSGTV